MNDHNANGCSCGEPSCEWHSSKARTELTEIGEQYVVPGCERRHDQATKPVQLGLWD